MPAPTTKTQGDRRRAAERLSAGARPGADRSGAARPRGAARREALLEAVLQIVAETGVDAVTHRRVAEVAALPLASTTYWFESKEHLLTAALELAAERDTARLLAQVAELSGGSAGRGSGGSGGSGSGSRSSCSIDAAVAAITEPLDEGRQASRGSLMATYALLLEAARRPALQDVARRWTEVYVVTLGQLLERAGSSRPREDAELLLGAADGLLIEQLASGETTDLRPRLRRLAVALVASP
jgi:DNA-binding transcriptional regulator YbjK